MARQEWCINHPNTPAAVHCRQCGKTICARCVKTAEEGRFCSDTCVEKYRLFQKRLATSSAGPSEPRRSLVKPLVVLALLAGTALAAWKTGLFSLLKDKGTQAVDALGEGAKTQAGPLAEADLLYAKKDFPGALKKYRSAVARAAALDAKQADRLTPVQQDKAAHRIADSLYEIAESGGWKKADAEQAIRAFRDYLTNFPNATAKDRDLASRRLTKLKAMAP